LHLWQYGIMAEVLRTRVLGIESPRVALMNIGAEEAKGTEMIKARATCCAQTPGLNYIGYIEGRDLFDGVADVVVTDGFTGNTVLKMAEGLAKSLFRRSRHEIFEHDPIWRCSSSRWSSRSTPRTTTTSTAAPRCWASTAC
jgi:phosphate acyltransferase